MQKRPEFLGDNVLGCADPKCGRAVDWYPAIRADWLVNTDIDRNGTADVLALLHSFAQTRLVGQCVPDACVVGDKRSLCSRWFLFDATDEKEHAEHAS